GRNGDGMALVDDAGGWTGRELRGHVARLARAMGRAGVGAGARVALLGGNSSWFAAAQLATVVAGGAYSGLYQSSPADELGAALASLGADALVFDPVTAGAVVTELAEGSVPAGCRLLSLGPHPAAVDLLAIAGGEPDTLAPVWVGDADPCSISWTGGTTGRS